MDEEQFRLVIELLKKNQRRLTIIQYLVGITLGFLMSVHLVGAF